MWGNSTLTSGCAQKVLSCTEVGFTSQTTPNSVMTWCMCIMELLSQDTLDDGRCCRQDSALCPKQLDYHDFIPQKLWKDLEFRNNEKRGRLMPGLNNTPSCGYSHKSNAIYLEEIHSELMEFYTSRLFLILTDCGNVVTKCQVW